MQTDDDEPKKKKKVLHKYHTGYEIKYSVIRKSCGRQPYHYTVCRFDFNVGHGDWRDWKCGETYEPQSP